jgi:hypothetical protein
LGFQATLRVMIARTATAIAHPNIAIAKLAQWKHA